MCNGRFWLGGLALAMLVFGGGSASAQTFTWNVNNGSFQNPNSWTPLGGPPGATLGVTAAFTGPSSLTQYLATFDSDWALNLLTMNQGATTFALNGHTLSVNNLAFLGNTASQTTTWNLSNGTLLSPNSFAYATGANATFTLNLDHAVFSANSFTDMASGTGSTFNLNIRNGSTYSALNNSFVGIVGSANVLVDGVGSSLSLGSGSRLGSGNGSSGNVTVQNGAAFNTVGGFTIGAQTGATGTVNVSGTGSIWTHRDSVIALGGGANGTLNINAGGTFNVTGVGTAAGISLNSNASMNVAGTVNINGVGQSGITLNAGVLSISTGGSLTTDYFTRNTGSSLGLNDGSLIINKQFNWNTAQFNISGIGGGDPVVQLQNGATTSGLAGVTLGATLGQRGTLRVLGGSTATLSGLASIGSQGPGAILIDGPGSSMVSTQPGGAAVQIGQSAVGTMTVQNGGAYTGGINTSIALGTASGGNGTLTVSGPGSSVSTGGMSIGQAGVGTLNILYGGSVSTVGSINLGEAATGSGSLTISGPGATLNDGFSLFIGGTSGASANNGSQITITNGGSATAAQQLGSLCTLWNGSSLTISGGGSLTVGGFTRLGTLNLNNGTLTTTSFFSNGNSPTPLAVQGLNLGDVATLQLANGATSNNISTLTVGGTRTGQINVMSGASLNVSSVGFASSSSGNGAISLSGNNSTLNVNGPMTFGSVGAGMLSVGNGSTATIAGTLTLGSSGTINLNGGTINVGAFTPNGGAFNWNNGTVAFTGTATLGSNELTTLLGANGTVSTGRTLRGSGIAGNPLAVTANLSVNGGMVTTGDLSNQGALTISAGTVQGTNSIANNSGASINVANGAQLSGATANSGELQLGGSAARLNGSLANSGRLSGAGTVAGNLSNNSSGRIIADAGQRLVFTGATNNNNSNGSIEMTGGTVEFTGTLNNNSNGLISGRGSFRGSSANVSGTGLINTGAVAFSAGTSDVYGKVTNTGNGMIVTVGGGTTTFHDDMLHNGAEIRTASGARTVFLGSESGAGNFTGSGTVEFQGDLRPGNSPAAVSFGGDMELGHSAKLFVEIGGTAPGMNFDQLNVANRASIDGSLGVALINGFTPTVGQRFDIMTFNSEIGDFSTFNGLNIGNGLALVPGIDSHSYFLQVAPVPEPATWLLTSLAAGGWYWRRRRARQSMRS